MFVDFIPRLLTVVDCHSILTVLCCGTTVSYNNKPINMIAEALVPGTQLMDSQFVTFAAHLLSVQQIFLTVICTPQSCFRDKSIEE